MLKGLGGCSEARNYAVRDSGINTGADAENRAEHRGDLVVYVSRIHDHAEPVAHLDGHHVCKLFVVTQEQMIRGLVLERDGNSSDTNFIDYSIDNLFRPSTNCFGFLLFCPEHVVSPIRLEIETKTIYIYLKFVKYPYFLNVSDKIVLYF